MADSKISELTALTSPASDDVLAIVDTDAGVTKKITVSNLQSSSFQFVLEDGDGTEVTINNNNEVKFVEGGGIDINWTDTDNGSDADPYDLTFSIDSTVATLTGSQTLTNKTLTSPVLNTGVSGTAVKDEDNMASDSATHLATQQSIKAYVDSTVAATNELVEDSSPQLGGDLDLNSNDITGTGNINITGGLTATSASTISVTDNSDTLTLKSTDADAEQGPILRLTRDSSSPANDDVLGRMFFTGEDAGGNATNYVQLTSQASNVAEGSETANFQFEMFSGGSNVEFLKFQGGTGTVFNEGSADLDFRVESDANTHAFFLEGSTGNIGIGTSSIDVITQAGGSGYRVLQLENNEGGQINLDHTDAGTGSTLGMINFNRAGETVAHIGGVTDGATDSGHINFRTQPASGALTERMRITSAGKVGIGTISPTRFVQLKDTSADMYIGLEGGTSNTVGILFGDTDDHTQSRIQHANSDNSLRFSTVQSERMRIDSSGNVGIGETSPASQLHITGATDAGGTISLKRPNTTVTAGQTLGAIEFITADSGSAGTAARILAEADGTGGEAKLVFNTGTGGSNTTRMIIDHDGNVKITRDDNVYLSIDSTQTNGDEWHIFNAVSGSTSQLQFKNIDQSKVVMLLDEAGKVGIGTTSPEDMLHVLGSASTAVDIGTDASAEVVAQFIPDSTNSRNGRLKIAGTNIPSNNSVAFISDASSNVGFSFNVKGSSITEAMVITSDGNVALGTTDVIQDFGDGRTSLALKGTGSQDYATVQLANNGTSANDQILGLLSFYDGAEHNARIDTIRASNTVSANMRFWTAPSGGGIIERMRIHSGGNVSIGTTDDHAKLTIMSASSGAACNADADELQIEGSGNAGMTIASGTSGTGNIHFADVGAANRGIISYDHSSDSLQFGTSGSVKGRFASNNDFLVGKSSTGIANTGVELSTDKLMATVSNATVLYINRLLGDGTLAQFHQAGTEEGSIEVSGSTVSYNGFTGSHWSRLSDNSKPTILRGTIMDSIDEMCDWYQAVADVSEVLWTADDPETQDTLWTEDDILPEDVEVGDVRWAATQTVGDVKEEAYTVKESIALGDKSVGDEITFTSDGTEYTGTIVKEDDVKHNKCKVSDTEDSKKVYGVFSNWDDADDGLDGDVNDMNIAQVGTFVIRVNADVTVEAGDLLVSNGDGTAKIQDDDIIRSKTVAKVNSNVIIETYSDGSYTVPCTLHC